MNTIIEIRNNILANMGNDMFQDRMVIGILISAAVATLTLLLLVGIHLSELIRYTLYKAFGSKPIYPYFNQEFNLKDAERTDVNGIIDNWLMESGGYELARRHEENVVLWKKKSMEQAEHSRLFKKYLLKQYEECLDEGNTYRFSFNRIIHGHLMTDRYYNCSFEYLMMRYAALIGQMEKTSKTMA